MNFVLKILGVIILIIGLSLTFKPDLFSKLPSLITGYQMIEKRVKWGALIGFGLFLIFLTDWTSWRLIVSGLLFGLTAGIIIARLTGFVLDGFFTGQLWWLLIEFTVAILFGYLYFKMIKSGFSFKI